jgi:hypothetical protein
MKCVQTSRWFYLIDKLKIMFRYVWYQIQCSIKLRLKYFNHLSISALAIFSIITINQMKDSWDKINYFKVFFYFIFSVEGEKKGWYLVFFFLNISKFVSSLKDPYVFANFTTNYFILLRIELHYSVYSYWISELTSPTTRI